MSPPLAVVLCRPPASTESKTRLARQVGHGQAQRLYRACLGHVLSVLLDLPATVAAARRELAAAGLTSRCEVVAGDFFTAVPPGAGAYLLQHILHDWNDEQATRILRTCRSAMPADGRILVVEAVLGPDPESRQAAFLDVDMMISTGGRERTMEEFAAVCTAAGLTLAKVVPTRSALAILDLRPAPADLPR